MKIFATSILCLLFSFPLLKAQTFTATVNQSIPDNNTVVAFNLPVSGLPGSIGTTFGLETACLTMTHTWCADMEVILRAPDGTQVLLFSGIGGSDDNFTGTCVAGTGSPIGGGSAPFTGTFKAQGPMGNVNNGQNPNGTWQLLCRDMAGQDVGFLVSWSLTFGANPAQPFIFASSNLPIVKLTTVSAPINNNTKVPVMMKIVDNGPGIRNYVSDTVYAYEGLILTEWQGFSGPSYPKKNYDFDLIDAQSNKIDTSLMGMPSENDWIFKAEYLDHSLLKNTITYEMARRMGRYAPRTRPCEIILDGQYIGYYTLTEKVKRNAERVDIAKLTANDISGIDLTGGYIIEMNINGAAGNWNSVYPPINNATCNFPVEFKYVYPKSTDILPVQGNYIKGVVDNFEAVLNGPNYADPVTGFRSIIDVGTFIDFLIVNEFSVNYDSYGRSTYMFKEKDTDGGLLKIGPPWDYDRAIDYTDPNRTSGWVWQITHPYWPFPFWWSRMDSDPNYRHELACRWMMLRQDILSIPAFNGLVDSTAAHLAEAADRNFTIWAELGNETYQDQVDSVKSYLGRRIAWMDQALAPYGASFPVFHLPTDTVVCAGTVFDAAYNGNQFEYNWQPGPDTSTITLNQDGVYNLQVTDQWGCYSHQSMLVTISVPDPSFAMQPGGGSGLGWDFSANDPSATSYAWDFGDATTASVANPSHTYANSGTYLVVLNLLDSIGCPAFSTQTLTCTFVGNAEMVDQEGRAYPNPFQDAIMVELAEETQEEGMLTLHDELGREVRVEVVPAGSQVIKMTTNDLPKGIYLLQVQVGDMRWQRKLMHD